MLRYIIRRALLAIPVVVLVSILSFAILTAAPGDPVLAMFQQTGELDPVTYEALRKEMGLDQPVVVQYLTWAGKALVGDFGISAWTRQPIGAELLQRVPVTLGLALVALVLVVVVGFVLGLLSGYFRDGPVDQAIRVFTAIGLAVPNFWFGLLIILMLVALFRWVPNVSGLDFAQNPLFTINQLFWPAVAMAYTPAAVIARLIRGSLIGVMDEEYIRVARSKGLADRAVVLHHALKNSIAPALAGLGFVAASLLTGSVVIESVFNLPGLGGYLITGIHRQDYFVVQAVMVLTAAIVVLVNLFVDVVQAFIDRRVVTR